MKQYLVKDNSRQPPLGRLRPGAEQPLELICGPLILAHLGHRPGDERRHHKQAVVPVHGPHVEPGRLAVGEAARGRRKLHCPPAPARGLRALRWERRERRHGGGHRLWPSRVDSRQDGGRDRSLEAPGYPGRAQYARHLERDVARAAVPPTGIVATGAMQVARGGAVERPRLGRGRACCRPGRGCGRHGARASIARSQPRSEGRTGVGRAGVPARYRRGARRARSQEVRHARVHRRLRQRLRRWRRRRSSKQLRRYRRGGVVALGRVHFRVRAVGGSMEPRDWVKRDFDVRVGGCAPIQRRLRKKGTARSDKTHTCTHTHAHTHTHART